MAPPNHRSPFRTRRMRTKKSPLALQLLRVHVDIFSFNMHTKITEDNRTMSCKQLQERTRLGQKARNPYWTTAMQCPWNSLYTRGWIARCPASLLAGMLWQHQSLRPNFSDTTVKVSTDDALSETKQRKEKHQKKPIWRKVDLVEEKHPTVRGAEIPRA